MKTKKNILLLIAFLCVCIPKSLSAQTVLNSSPDNTVANATIITNAPVTDSAINNSGFNDKGAAG